MAGTWTAVPLAPFSFNSTPTTGSFYPGPTAPASFGYASSGTSTITAPTAWGSAPNAVAVPNTGSVLLWYWCGATGAGITQVLVGEQVTGQVLPATTAMTLAANSSGLDRAAVPGHLQHPERDHRARVQHRHRVDARRVRRAVSLSRSPSPLPCLSPRSRSPSVQP